MPFAGIFPFLCFRIRERLPGHPGTLFPCSAPDDAFSGKKLQSVLSPFQILNFIQLFLFFFARISAGPRPEAVDAGQVGDRLADPVSDRLTAPFQNRGRRERWSVPSRRPAGMSGRNRPDGERKEDSSGRHCAWSAGHDRHIRPAFQILDRRRNFMIALLPPSPSPR